MQRRWHIAWPGMRAPQPHRGEARRRRAEDVVLRMISDKPDVLARAIEPAASHFEDAGMRLVNANRSRHHDSVHELRHTQALDLRLLELHGPVRHDAQREALP